MKILLLSTMIDMAGTQFRSKERCEFCAIARREAPARITYEDDSLLAFTPLEPVTPGHLLLIPKAHSESILDIDTDLLSALSARAQELAAQMIDQDDVTGINLLHASGKDAQQSVLHFHLHIVPRRPEDGLDLWFRNSL